MADICTGRSSRGVKWLGRSAAIVAVALVVLLLCVSSALAAWPDPQRVSVGMTQNQNNPQIALDASGNPNVVWYGNDGSTDQVYYAENTGSGWTPQLVSTGTTTGNVLPQLALDSAGNPNVVWYGNDGSTDQVYYAENTGSGWTPQLVSTGTTTDNYDPQIALDSAGNPNVVWYGDDGPTDQIYYAENTGSGWTPQLVSVGTTPVDFNPQIALDSAGNPNVVWYGGEPDGSTWQVYFAENTGSGWTPQLVSTGTTTYNSNPQIALDSAGNPNAVWYGWDGSGYQVNYAENTGSGWTPQQVSTGGTTNLDPQIALDSDGNPNVVWFGRGSTWHVYYAENTGSGWTPQLVSTGTAIDNRNPYIALDSAGNPNVVWRGYVEATDTVQAYYAENTGSGWTPQLVSTGTTTGNFNVHVALDSAGNPRVAWYGYDVNNQIYYSAPTWNISASADPTAGGAVTGAGYYQANATVNMHAAPNAGYHFVNWTEGGIPVSTSADYSFAASADRTLVANFAVDNYTVNASVSGGHGTVSPSTQAVNHGSDATVTITPDTGYHAASVTDNGTAITPVPTTSCTLSNVTENHEVIVTFASDTPPTASYLAEGTNAWGFNTYITIENPNNQQVTARLTYMDPNPQSGAGVVGTRDVTLPALSQTTVSSMEDIGAVDFSTRVECTEGKTIAVDRTMFWTGEGTNLRGYHSSVASDTLSKTWYLPEGSSAWGFETWTCVLNPNATPAKVTLTYMTEAGPKTAEKTIPPDSRATCPMVNDVGNVDASIQVSSDVPVMAERSIYRNNRREGSCSLGATAPAADFYLAEGATGYAAGFTTYILVQNPGTETNKVTLTFNTEDGAVAGPSFEMAPGTRKTVKVNDSLPANTDVSTTVHGTKPLVAERAMYWDAGLGECFHASIGLAQPHMTFMLPDGQADSNAQTYTLVANPNPGAVTVRITYLKAGGGAPVSFTAEIPKESRATFNMADKIKDGRASILVESLDGARPVMVERAMYGADWGSGTDTIGASSD